MALQWQQHEVLKTAGSIVRAGTWKGDNRDENGNLIESTITSSEIQKIYGKLTDSDPIPMYVDFHGKNAGDVRHPIGYAFKVGISEDGTDIVHNGFVFNPEAKKAIATGLDRISPEFKTIIDRDGRVVDRNLTGICFVKNAAMEGTEVNYMFEKFESPSFGDAGSGAGGNSDSSDAGNVDVASMVNDAVGSALKDLPKLINEAVSKGLSTQGAEINQPGAKKPEGGQPPSTGTPGADVKDQKTGDGGVDLSGLTSQIAEQKVFIDQMLSEKYNTLVGRVKELGISDPASIVAGLSVPQAIEILSKTEVNLIQNASTRGVPKNPGSPGGGQGSKTQEQTFNECMAEVGLTDEKYLKMFSK